MENKLFDVYELINDPKKLEELNMRNSNIGQYVNEIKKTLGEKNQYNKN